MKTVRGDDHYSTVLLCIRVLLNYFNNSKRWRTKQKYYAIVNNIIFIIIITTVFCTAEDSTIIIVCGVYEKPVGPCLHRQYTVTVTCLLVTSTALAVRRKQK